MRFLLTGANGFIGSRLLAGLIQAGHEVIILKRKTSDLWRIEEFLPFIQTQGSDLEDIESVFRDGRIDVVVHLATDYGRKNGNNFTQMLWPNIQMPARLLELAGRYEAKAFINADTSTDSKYTMYSAMKKSFLDLARAIIFNSRLKFVNMVLGYVYGEMDDNTKFIPHLIESILNSVEIDATAGEQKRDFIYVGDVVDAYIHLIKNIDRLEQQEIEMGIATGRTVSLKEFARMAAVISGKKMNVRWGTLPYRAHEVFDLKIDVAAPERILAWRAGTSLEQGLKKTIEWYESQIVTRSRRLTKVEI